MKFNSSETISNSNFKEKKRITATIDNPVKILRMFTKDLYKNPLQTAVQEYINNAKDAHLMAGKDTSTIEITAPTVANQNVIIKDFGLGLSPDDIVNVFARITASNKDHSNLFNGGFGIGSKSWFAINPTFFVNSTYNGIKSYYEVSFTDNIFIDLLEEHECDEPNGVEVTLPLATTEQLKPAVSAIKRAVKFWKHRPKLINMELLPLPILFENDDFRLIAINTKTQLAVTLGETQYSINDFEQLHSYRKYADKCSIELKFKVGEVKLKKSQEVGPDREQFIQEMEEPVIRKFNIACNTLRDIYKDLLKDETDFKKIHDVLQMHEAPNNHEFDYKGLKLKLSSRHKSATPSVMGFKTVWSQLGKNESYLQLIKEHMLVLTEDIDLGKHKKSIAHQILDKTRKAQSIHFCKEVPKKQLKVLKKYIEVKKLSSFDYKLPKQKKAKLEEKNPSINLISYSSKDEDGNYIISSARKKVKLEDMDKKIPIVVSVNWNKSWKPYISGWYERTPKNETRYHKLEQLKMEFLVVSQINARILLNNGFKALDTSVVDTAYEELEYKREKEKKARLEKEMEKLRKEALSKDIQDKMKYYRLSEYLSSSKGKGNLSLPVDIFKERLKEHFPDNKIVQNFVSKTIPCFRDLNKLKNKFKKACDFEKTFSQDYTYLKEIKKLRKEHRLLFYAISVPSKTAYENYKKEISYILKGIKKENG